MNVKASFEALRLANRGDFNDPSNTNEAWKDRSNPDPSFYFICGCCGESTHWDDGGDDDDLCDDCWVATQKVVQKRKSYAQRCADMIGMSK